MELVLGVGKGHLSPVPVTLEDVPHEDVLNVINDCIKFDSLDRPTFKEIESRLSKIMRSCQNEQEIKEEEKKEE